MPLKMPPRFDLCPSCLHPTSSRKLPLLHSRYASTASAITPAPSFDQSTVSVPPIARYPPSQPPSHRPPEFRKSQLHRQYTSILRSTPLMLIFQHNNLKANEWMAIRRELAQALHKTDETELAAGRSTESGFSSHNIKLQTIQVSIFEAAMRVVEAWDPKLAPSDAAAAGITLPPFPSDPATQSSTDAVTNATPSPADPSFTHALSRAAYEAGLKHKFRHELAPLLNGPVALLTFPTVAPAHLKAALSILAPKAPAFPAPTRRANPGYYDAAVQTGLQKLMLLGARIEGKVFDFEKVRW
ncbi:MAG: hypothetical protein Q9167_006363, partial [Letrouitia subvulpina]